MATTTNYAWTTPDDTDLVKDGASAIRTLGSAIDTTVFNNAGAAIAKSIVDAKGDIIAATAADTVSRLAVGSNNQVLTADSTTGTGLKWATPAAGSYTSLASGSLPASSSLTLSSISADYKELKLILRDFSVTLNNNLIQFRLNGDTGSNYGHVNYFTTAIDTVSLLTDSVDTKIENANSLRADNNFVVFTIQDYANTSSYKSPTILGVGRVNGDTQESFIWTVGFWKSVSAVNEITVFSGNTFDGGTYELFGVK